MNIKETLDKFIEVQNLQIETKERRKSNGEVFTPDWLVDKMCKTTSKTQYKSTLDLCAGIGQFTAGLLRNNIIKNLDNHTFCEKDPENIEKLKYIFGDDIKLYTDYIYIHDYFDLIITNPPYNKAIDLKIISHMFPYTDEIIAVHPSTWILDRKFKYKPFVDFRKLLNNKVRSVEFFNGNPVFNIGLFVPCMITHIDKSYSGPIDCNYFGDRWQEQNIFEITKFGSSWHTLIKPFFEQIRDYCLEHGSIWDYNITELPEDFKKDV